MKITKKYIEHSGNSSLEITDAYFVGDFAIRITFNDGKHKLVDFKPFLESSHHSGIKKYGYTLSCHLSINPD